MAVTGLKIHFSTSVSMVDACHIVPFAETHDDTISNGIALSPTIHRAFDRGLLSISDDYRVLVHKKVQDFSRDIPFSQLHKQQLFLPEEERFYPSRERLGWHRGRYGF
jgi:putative restriction endonuclease